MCVCVCVCANARQCRVQCFTSNVALKCVLTSFDQLWGYQCFCYSNRWCGSTSFILSRHNEVVKVNIMLHIFKFEEDINKILLPAVLVMCSSIPFIISICLRYHSEASNS